MSNPRVNKALVKEVFYSMAYCSKKMEVNQRMDDFPEQQSIDEINSLITQFVNCDKFYTIDSQCRQKLINKLATEIEKREESILELLINVAPCFIRKTFLHFFAETLRYYSNYCQLVEENFKNVLVCKLSEVSNFSLLGYIFGPSLAAGYRILFVVSHHLYKVLKFIQLMMSGIGFPEGSISVMLDDFDINLVSQHANIISLFGMYNHSLPNIKVLSVLALSTPIIVFDNADVDSACECVINVTWNHQLLFDSTANEVFVQENIFEKFVKKLKENMSTNSNYHNTLQGQLKILISRAEKIGVEVFPCNADISSKKIMFIGGKVFDKSTTVPCISVVAFRNIDEAIALANNNIQGLSASVWTENIGLANYVAQKLEVSNVWINSFGIYSFDVAFTPKKLSGQGYFGGIQGFQEYLFKKKIKTHSGKNIILQDGENIFFNIISTASKAFISWSKLPKSKRIFQFNEIIQYIEINRDEFQLEANEWLNQWRTLYYEYIAGHYDFSITSPIQGHSLNVTYSARGVIVAETTNNMDTHNIKLIIASIIEGNSCILLNHCEQLQKFYTGLSKVLPVGIFSVMPYFSEASKIALRSPEVEAYFNEYVIDNFHQQLDKFETVTTAWKDIFNKVTCIKNIWCNIGK